MAGWIASPGPMDDVPAMTDTKAERWRGGEAVEGVIERAGGKEGVVRAALWTSRTKRTETRRVRTRTRKKGRVTVRRFTGLTNRQTWHSWHWRNEGSTATATTVMARTVARVARMACRPLVTVSSQLSSGQCTTINGFPPH